MNTLKMLAMIGRHGVQFSGVLAALAVLGTRQAGADVRGCPSIAIDSDDAFRSQFPQLLEQVHRDLSARNDIDSCAHVTLGAEQGQLDVLVTLPDGRATSRSALRREDVIPTLQALLLVPERAPDPTPAPAPPVVPAPPTVWRGSNEYGEREQLAPPARPIGFELSVISGVRLGDGQLGYGAGALSLLAIQDWLAGFQGRVDAYRPLDGGDPESALELALLGGRRFRFATVSLDLTAGPGVAIKGITLSNVTPARAEPAGPPLEEQSSGPVPRLLLGARLGFFPRKTLRTFIGVDGELGPGRAAGASELGTPRMPTFSVGLALGATVGVP